ncbi:hypothetical protein J6590_062555 [Homalodisca vitripennis]|nr:hypothetical protein J6590_062555 [Homalodisca vitripennis]
MDFRPPNESSTNHTNLDESENPWDRFSELDLLMFSALPSTFIRPSCTVTTVTRARNVHKYNTRCRGVFRTARLKLHI